MLSHQTMIWWRCLVAGICTITGTWMLNTDVISVFSATDPLARDIVFTLGGIAPFVLFTALARRKYSLFRGAFLALLSCIAVLLGAFLFIYTASSGHTVLSPLSFFLCLAGRSWVGVLLSLALCQLKNLKTTTVCICLFLTVGLFTEHLVTYLPSSTRVVLLGVSTCLTTLLVYDIAGATLRASSKKDVQDLALSQPRAFISSLNPAFLSIMILRLVYGFFLALNSISGIPVETALSGFATLGVACWAYLGNRVKHREDALFDLAALLVVMGLLAAMISLEVPLGSLSNLILSSASAIFSVLQYLLIVALCRRNLSNAITIAAGGEALSSVGTLLGASTGHSLNYLIGTDRHLAFCCIAILILSFVTYCFVWIRRFSYDRFIYGVEKIKPIVVPQANETEVLTLQSQCDKLISSRGLTKREGEILAMLARGRNGKFIQSHYTVSYNTVKTHVKHIYMKLGVHSQQEIIDLIENT